MVRDPKIVRYVEELDLLIIADGGKLYHINGDVIAGIWKAYAEGHGIDYDICEGCERVDPETAEPTKHGRNLSADYPSLFECSVCGYVNDDTYSGCPHIFNYCPNCGAQMDETPDCETCKDRKTCKDAPIPPIYACLGYRPAESTMGQVNSDEAINHHIENDGTYAAGEEEPDGH